MTKIPPPLLTATTPGSLVGSIMLSLLGLFLIYNTGRSLSRKHIIYKNIRYTRADDPLFYWLLTALSLGIGVMCTVLGVLFTLNLIQSTGHS